MKHKEEMYESKFTIHQSVFLNDFVIPFYPSSRKQYDLPKADILFHEFITYHRDLTPLCILASLHTYCTLF